MKPIYFFLKKFTSRFSGLENILALFIPKTVGLLSTILTSILIVRGLSIGDVGSYTLIVSYYVLVMLLSDLGINQTVLRYASKVFLEGDDYHKRLIRWGTRLKVLSASIIAIVLLLAAPFVALLWESQDILPLMRLGLISGIFGSLAAIPILYFQSKQAFKPLGILLIVQSVMTLTPILYVHLTSSWSVENVVLAGLFSSVVNAIVGFSLIPTDAWFMKDEIAMMIQKTPRQSFFSFQMPSNQKFKIETLSPMAYLFFILPAAALFAVSSRIDVWLMGIFLSKTEIGIYGMAQRIALPLLTVSEAIDGTISPAASIINDRAAVKGFLKTTLKTISFFGVFILLYALLTPLLIPTIFGIGYEAGMGVASILCLRYAITLISSPFTWLAYNFDYAKIQWAIRILQLTIVIGINLTFLSMIGVYASTLSWIFYELVGLLGASVYLYLTYRRANNQILQ